MCWSCQSTTMVLTQHWLQLLLNTPFPKTCGGKTKTMLVGTLGGDNKKAPDSHWKRPQKTNVKTPHVVHELPVIGHYTRFWGSEWSLGSLYPILLYCSVFRSFAATSTSTPPKTKIPKKIMKQASHDGSAPLWPSSVLLNTTTVKIGNVPWSCWMNGTHTSQQQLMDIPQFLGPNENNTVCSLVSP